MQTAYVTSKTFADGSIETRIKINPIITETKIARALRSRRLNKKLKEKERKKLIEQLNEIPFTSPDYQKQRYKIERTLNLRNVENVRRSANRARQNLYDICKSNDFSYFVTLTFDKTKINRLNDHAVKRAFTSWANYVRKKFPNMYYIATPEYHKKGGLHFHLLVGGITMSELKCEPSKDTNGLYIFKNGKQIYNINAWKKGFSTLSKIENQEASKHYVCKYITKQNLDDRFFGKRRYYTSRNINRPTIEKWQTSPADVLDDFPEQIFLINYFDPRKRYAVLTHDGNGVIEERNGQGVWSACAQTLAVVNNTTSCKEPSRVSDYST